jgi:hypothetical protein
VILDFLTEAALYMARPLMQRQTARKVSDRRFPRMDDGLRRSHGPRRPVAHGPSFKSGDVVPQTGIYEVVHARGHRVPHEVVLHREDAFPDCEGCGADVRFRVIRTAPYIFDDEDFEPGS